MSVNHKRQRSPLISNISVSVEVLDLIRTSVTTQEDIAEVIAIWTKAISIIFIGCDKADGIGVFKNEAEMIKSREIFPGRILLFDFLS